MTQQTDKYIKKATVSNAEFIGQLAEAILGIVICIVGAVIGFSSEAGFTGPALILLLIGAYLAIGGLSGAIPYGIGALCEKGKYIAFDETKLVIHSPNAKKCVNVSLSKIADVKKTRPFPLTSWVPFLQSARAAAAFSFNTKTKRVSRMRRFSAPSRLARPLSRN